MLEVAQCHYCKAEIDWDALKCRHCGEWVGEPRGNAAGAPGPAVDQPVPHFVPAHDDETAVPGMLGWLGTGGLVAGVFLPFLSMPILGGISFWNVRGDGVFVLSAGVVALVAHWRQWRMLMLAATVPAVGLVGYDVIRTLRELRGDASGLISLGFGAFVMLAGGIAAVVSASRTGR